MNEHRQIYEFNVIDEGIIILFTDESHTFIPKNIFFEMVKDYAELSLEEFYNNYEEE